MFKKTLLWIAVLVYSFNLSGCFLIIPAVICVVGGAAIGVGTATWMSDKLVEQVPYGYDKTVQASRDGVSDMKMAVIKETDTDTLTQISCKYDDGRTVWINVAKSSPKVSRIEVRVGAWGGKADATKVLDAILNHLK